MGDTLSPGFDPEYAFRCYEENLRPIVEHYFRARLVNEHLFPFDDLDVRPIILTPNHSGMGLSWDNIIFDFLVYDLLARWSGDRQRAIRNKLTRMVAPPLISRTAVRPFGLEDWWARTRCVPATYKNLDDAARRKRLFLNSPEGVAGISKGFHKRYQLQQYSTSFLAVARTHGATVVPVSVVNAEYLRPFAYCSETVNRLVQRVGMPFFPLGPGMFEVLVPAAFLSSVLPAKLTYVLHEPIRYPADPRLAARDALRTEVDEYRQRHQGLLNEAVALYHEPFDWVNLARHLFATREKRAMLPFLWHEMFLETDGIPAYVSHMYKVPLGYPLVQAAKRWHRRSTGGQAGGAGPSLNRPESTSPIAATSPVRAA